MRFQRGLEMLVVPLVALGALLASIQSPTVGAPPHAPREVRDMTGRPVALPAHPQRAVVFPPILTRYFTIDNTNADVVGGSGYAIDAQRGGMFSVDRVTEVARQADPGNPEVLLGLRPDAVILWAPDAPSVERLGLRAVRMTANPRDVRGTTVRTWNTLGNVTGKSQRASWILALGRDEQRRFTPEISARERHPTFVSLYGDGGIGIGGRYAHLNDAIHQIGGRNAADRMVSSAATDVEELLLLNPDVILLVPGFPRSPSELYADPAWQGLRAVRARRIYAVPALADINGPIDAPFFVRWLTIVAYHTATGTDWRKRFKHAYRMVYGRAPSEHAIDSLLRVRQNASSAGYSTFMPSGGCCTKSES
jgi:iron complex transport system substrate-binding protein